MGARLRERRRGLGLTLSEAAQKAGISTSYLSAIEIGNSVPSLPILARVVGALDLSLNEVLRDVGTTVVRSGRLDRETAGAHVASHDGLLLEVAFVVSVDGEEGPSPVTTAGHEVFVYVLEGALETLVNGKGYDLGAGDSLATESPETLEYRARGPRTVALWASIMDGQSSRGAR
ncbi:MAG TPA: XRE family transcriptional regulator [Gaiellaceae bacterium]|nr:XRE family transcriptional regulator [Gaiellaceae bacterium]